MKAELNCPSATSAWPRCGKKFSGARRNADHTQACCRISSCLQSMSLQGCSSLGVLQNALNGNAMATFVQSKLDQSTVPTTRLPKFERVSRYLDSVGSKSAGKSFTELPPRHHLILMVKYNKIKVNWAFLPKVINLSWSRIPAVSYEKYI